MKKQTKKRKLDRADALVNGMLFMKAEILLDSVRLSQTLAQQGLSAEAYAHAVSKQLSKMRQKLEVFEAYRFELECQLREEARHD